MIELDGSYGEGGGQILRTALILSPVSGKAFRMRNIRSKRRVPGLRRQHLGCVELAAEMTDAETSEAEVGSTELTVYPRSPGPGDYEIDIGAGSVTLLSSVFLPISALCREKSVLKAVGGTDVPFSPTSSFFSYAFLPMLSEILPDADYSVRRRGYYPKGKGEVRLEAGGRSRSAGPGPLTFTDKGEHVDTIIRVESSNLPEHISRRIISSFRVALAQRSPEVPVRSRTDVSFPDDKWRVGVSATAVSRYENGMVATSRCGRKGLPSERIGRELAEKLSEEMGQPCVDPYLSDQLLPYLAVYGGKICVVDPTPHFTTGLYVIGKFLGKCYERRIEEGCEEYEFSGYRSHA